MSNFQQQPDRALRADVSVRRVSDAPIVAFGSVEGYGPIFNAGVVHHDGRYHLFARGVRDGYLRNPGEGARFLDYISDILVFVSEDGESYEFQQVIAEASPAGVHCYEDARVQRISSNDSTRWVMSYTNLPAPEPGRFWRIGLDELFYADGRFTLTSAIPRLVGPESEPNKDAVIFTLRDGRVAMIHRIHPNMQIAVFDTLDDLWDPPSGYWDDHLATLDRHVIIEPAADSLGVGAGAPPIETDDGLVLLYHERGGDEHYTTMAALLDAETGRVKTMLPEPIMRPQLSWECEGDVNNVVFVQGAVMRPDGDIYVTYGAADRCVGAAVVSTGDLLRALRAAG